jgi:hypothetical protein
MKTEIIDICSLYLKGLISEELFIKIMKVERYLQLEKEGKGENS